MHYYQFHIGDFRSGTVNMTRRARWIYRDMIDIYYDLEQPLTLDVEELCSMLGAETQEDVAIVERHLRFKFEKTEDGYRHEVCDRVIDDYHSKASTARANGKLGGRPKKNPEKPGGLFVASDSVAIANQEETGSEANQEPITSIETPCHQQADDVTKKRDPVPYQKIIDLYNKTCGHILPQCIKANEARKRNIRKCWNMEIAGSKPFQRGEFWEAYFNDCLSNPHWCGQNDRAWKADIEFVTRETSVLKLLESQQ